MNLTASSARSTILVYVTIYTSSWTKFPASLGSTARYGRQSCAGRTMTWLLSCSGNICRIKTRPQKIWSVRNLMPWQRWRSRLSKSVTWKLWPSRSIWAGRRHHKRTWIRSFWRKPYYMIYMFLRRRRHCVLSKARSSTRIRKHLTSKSLTTSRRERMLFLKTTRSCLFPRRPK